ncbi:MAG: FimB/Mfa2 family fimbrial subunit [Prevotella sp.]|nr:FimB/Mfa2 family fimbrial subunit [Prevotella sp.]
MKNEKLVLAYLRCVAVVIACCVLSACNGVIYDGEGDCAVNYKVRFRYDYNMKYADAFSHEVSWVTLYLIDNNGKVVWQKTEDGEALAREGYAMDVDVASGRYSMLAWCGTNDKGTFIIPEADVSAGLTCTLNRLHDNQGNAYVDTDLDRLFHGYEETCEFPERAGTYYYTVPLVKDTNMFRVVLQHISGTAVDSNKYTFEIIGDNGKMDWDNSLMNDEETIYIAWNTTQGEGGVVSDGAINTFTAAIAELTTARIVKGHEMRLKITNNETGKQLLSIPLTDYALLVKGYYNEDMDDQEYLDRQDEYNIVFFLDEGDRWIDNYIYINSWKVVLQNAGL